jgi:uncharacterized protein DUF29
MSSLAGATSARITPEHDFHAWLLEQAALLRKKRFNQLDWSNIAEELEAMASAERRELLRRLATIFEHFLKMEYEPEVRRERGRKTTIAKTRTGIERILEESPGLKGQLEEFAQKAYADGCKYAGTDLGLTRREWEKLFPQTSPWTLRQIRDDDFFPSPPKGK